MNIKKKRAYVALATLLVVILFVLARQHIYMIYMQVFNQTGIVRRYNSDGKLDGKYTSYTNGKIDLSSNFKDGKRDGWCTWYYENSEQKRREIYYKKGVPDGIEKDYYANGSLNYMVEWKDNRYINSQYHYLDNGALNTYNAYGFTKSVNNGYCYIGYDSTGKFHQMLGSVFSSHLYSVCKDSIIMLDNAAGYDCLKDLYISVATPPQLITDIKAFVNNVSYTKLDVRHNTILIPNIFATAGRYKIAIYGRLKTPTGSMIKSDSLVVNLFKR